MHRLTHPARPALLLLAILAIGMGCSRVTLVYESAGFLARQYARDYLDLSGDQLERWEPRLRATLARHRAEELPRLAAFFDQTLEASQRGFDAANTACLTAGFRDLYRDHARLAVGLAAPLLTDLTPGQIQALEDRFRRESREDRTGLAKRDRAWEQHKRARRYVEAIEHWTGPLNASQRAIVAGVTGRMPDSEPTLIEYRDRKRAQLIARLRDGGDEPGIHAFLDHWLVGFNDLPPPLERAGEAIGERIGELLIRLGASLDQRQRDRLEDRLRRLRDDLMRLQERPRLAPMTC